MWKDYTGVEKALPDHPFLIVVPPTLVDQVTQECARFLKPGSMDLVPITGAVEQRRNLWTEVGTRSHIAENMRLFIASTTVSVNIEL